MSLFACWQSLWSFSLVCEDPRLFCFLIFPWKGKVLFILIIQDSSVQMRISKRQVLCLLKKDFFTSDRYNTGETYAPKRSRSFAWNYTTWLLGFYNLEMFKITWLGINLSQVTRTWLGPLLDSRLRFSQISWHSTWLVLNKMSLQCFRLQLKVS